MKANPNTIQADPTAQAGLIQNAASTPDCPTLPTIFTELEILTDTLHLLLSKAETQHFRLLGQNVTEPETDVPQPSIEGALPNLHHRLVDLNRLASRTNSLLAQIEDTL